MIGEIKLGQNVIAKIEGNKAEIIANYSNMSLLIEFDKFDVEKIAKKIHNIVRQSHKFSILTIQKVLVMLSTDKLYNEISKKMKKAKDNGNIELLLKIYNLLEES